MQADVGDGLELRPAPGELAVDDLLARVDARVELGHEDLDGVAELLAERVERADVVAVAMRERDPADRATGRLGRLDQRVGRAAGGRVDEREAVVLAHEEGVDEAEARELDEVRGDDVVFIASI